MQSNEREIELSDVFCTQTNKEWEEDKDRERRNDRRKKLMNGKF